MCGTTSVVTVLIIVTASANFAIAFRMQSVGVKGILMCGPVPLADAAVKLWDKDPGPDPDDLMAFGFTNTLGFFNISGTEKELTNIDPKLKVYHDCDNVLPCQRKATFNIPDKYIHAGDRVDVLFDLGIVNMEAEFEDEERKCF